MSAPTCLLPRPSTEDAEVPDGEGMDLATLLALLALPEAEEDPAPGAPGAAAVSAAVAELWGLVREWPHRAARWGAGPRGAWRAW
jgi:hypothetical protein